MDSDEESIDGEKWKELHLGIQNGDIEYVRRVLQIEDAHQHFWYERTSALYRAFRCEQYEIASYLIHKGATIPDSEDLDSLDLKRLNHLLLQYNRKTDKSCIYQLISWSQSPQGLEGDRLRAVISLYEEFYESPILRLIMMVIGEKEFPIVYDFESEFVNRLHRLYEEEAEIYGLTLTNEREIFVGAKNLLSNEKRAKVCGVVAEEFCHLALTILFENDAKPYREEESELKKEFKDIVRDVQSTLDETCHVESVIKDVYRNYERHDWECELIARVPHVIGIYGEEKGRITMESRELYRLFSFYVDNVRPKCKEFTEPTLNTKAHRLMEQVLSKNNFISYQEKQVPPLKDGFPSFRESLVDVERVSVITTNSEKICTLQIYHELKREYGDALEKKCIFVSWKRFEEERERILDALRGRAWKYLIVVLDEEELNLRRLTCKYLDEFEEFKGEEMKIAVISAASLSLGPKFEKKRVKYKWNDLTDDFKALQQKIRYLFRGEEDFAYIAKERFQELFSEEEILRIVSGTVFKVCDGEGLYSHDYSSETYVDRKFEIMTIHKEFFKHIPSNTSVFLSGFSKFDFSELQIHSNVVQWISGPDAEIQESKTIFIDDIYKPLTFKEFVRRNRGISNIWVQYDRKTFYLRCSDSSDDALKRFVSPITFQEKEMMEFLKKNRIAIISESAGCGKSTVISNLIRRTKETFHHSWVWRIDFNKFVMSAKDRSAKQNPLSLGNINPDSDEEDVLEYFYLILGLNTGLEKYLFKDLSRYGECFVFCDGFDEIPSKYVNSALKLLSIVSEKTHAKMMVTTRKHQQKQLEEILNRISHQLEPFSRGDQVTFLDKFWKHNLMSAGAMKVFKKYQKAVARKMKKIVDEQKVEKTKSDLVFENMEHALEKIESADSFDSVMVTIESLDFKELAEGIIDKTLFDDGIVRFLGVPLHLSMVAVIYLNGNFNIEVEYDIYRLYQQFIEQKILIYFEEKKRIPNDDEIMETIVESFTERAYMIHMELALRWSVGRSMVCLNEDDWKFCSDLGIVCFQSGGFYFIHKTFAEFFISELTIKGIEKSVFLEILSGFEYKIIRRFLSSALREKDFENYELFEDSDFLTDVIDRTLTYSAYYVVYESNSEMFSNCKIVKKLLQNFEAADDTKTLVHEFIDRFHEHVMSKLERKFAYCNSIGGCLTAYMLKILLARDLLFYCRCITIFVRVSENVKEVTDVLNACISINKDLRCSADIYEEGNELKDSLLDILDHKISQFHLLHALSNEKSEIFAHILQLYWAILGRERFISEIVENEEYTKQVMLYLSNVSLNRFCSTFEALQISFGDELENLFIKDIKVWILYRAAEIDGRHASTNSLQRVISSFRKCFGIEKVKDFLLSHDFEDDYLINMAIRWFSSSIFMDYLLAFENNLDNEEMKQLLRSRKEGSKNVFHWVVWRDLYLKDLLQFFKDRLEEDEIKEMLSDSDANGDNLMHMILRFNSSDKMEMNLAEIKQYLRDDGLFFHLLKSRNSELMNFYHFSAANANKLDLSFLPNYLSTSEMTELLLQTDSGRGSFLHHAACYYLMNLPFFLEYAHRMFKTDGSRFRKLVFMKTKHGNTFLHVLQSLYFGWNPNVFHLVFDKLRQTLPREHFRRLLKVKNKNGQTFLQTERRYEFEIKTVFKNVLEADLFEELSEKESNRSNVYISALLHGIVIACSIYDKLTNSNAYLNA